MRRAGFLLPKARNTSLAPLQDLVDRSLDAPGAVQTSLFAGAKLAAAFLTRAAGDSAH